MIWEGIYSAWLSDLWRFHVESSPLNKGEWFFQEHFLSPMILHVSEQIFWKCKTMNVCETIATGDSSLSGYEVWYRNLSTVRDDLSAASYNVSVETLHNI
jgi:hypothetical protein